MRWLLLALFLAFPASADGVNEYRRDAYKMLAEGRVENSLSTIGHFEGEIHEGNAFMAAYFAESVADDATIVFAMTTAATQLVHIVVNAESGGDASVMITEGPTIGGGTTITPVDLNRTTSNTSSLSIVHTPTTNSGGTELITEFVAGGQKNFATGGSGGDRSEIIFKVNTAYTITLKNLAGSAKTLAMIIEWYEPT